MEFTDTHCHLDLPKFDNDRRTILERAAETGISHILIPGIDVPSCKRVLNLATAHAGLYAAVGVHPTEAGSWDDGSREALKTLCASSRKVVAIGEVGLDYYWDAAPHDVQKAILLEQLLLAGSLELPVVIHFREKGDVLDGACVEDLYQILESWVRNLEGWSRLKSRVGVLHSYSGSEQYAKAFIALGFYLGVTGPVTYMKSRQELIASLPLNRLLLETDAPYLTPSPWRGRRNEPAYVKQIADKIAEIMNTDLAEVSRMTTLNAWNLFLWE